MKRYIISYKNRPIGESGESCNSEYDLTNSCNRCGTGAQLKGSLRVKGFSQIEKSFFETLDGDFIISEKLYLAIKEVFPDFALKRVVDSKNTELRFYHFDSMFILPPFAKNSNGFTIEEQCENCQRNGYFNQAIIGDLEKKIPTIVRPLNLVYKQTDFSHTENSLILKTWECCGLSNKVANEKRVIRYARPWILIHETLKEILDSEGIKSVEYEMIKIE